MLDSGEICDRDARRSPSKGSQVVAAVVRGRSSGLWIVRVHFHGFGAWGFSMRCQEIQAHPEP